MRRRIKTASEAKSKNGVSLKKPCPAKRSMRSAPINARLPTRQMYSSFSNMNVRGQPVCQNWQRSAPVNGSISLVGARNGSSKMYLLGYSRRARLAIVLYPTLFSHIYSLVRVSDHHPIEH